MTRRTPRSSKTSGAGGIGLIKRRFSNRLETKLIFAVLLSLCVAALVFVVGVNCSFAVMDNIFYSSDYQERSKQRGLDRLQDFIDESGVSLADLRPLDEWCRQERRVYLSVYENDILVYDSVLTANADYTVYNSYFTEYTSEDYVSYTYTDENSSTGMTKALPQDELPVVRFKDGEAEIDLYTYYEDWYYNMACVAAAILAFLMFLLVLTGMIRAKLAYIGQLEREIRILEGGDLRYPLTVRGRDELGDLARGIEDMRRSVIERDAAEEKARRANQELITAMSHDLRTPLTSLLGYLDIVIEKKYTDETQRDRYLQVARDKAYQIKNLSDKLFEYFFVYSQESEELPRELLPADDLLTQLLGERAFELESRGFAVGSDLRPTGRSLRVNIDLLCRMCDNMFSNVRKYADPAAPVWISCVPGDDRVVITVQNGVAPRDAAVESTNIGLKTCESGAAAHGGRFTVRREADTFTAELILPLE